MVSAHDFMPTLLDYLDLPMPEAGENPRPGRSVLPVFRGESDAGREEVVVHSEYGNARMLRTERWKYVHRYPQGPHELYDLESDPDERENLIDDPDRRERIEDLRTRLATWFGEHVDPARDGARFPVTGRGQLAKIDPDHPGEGVFQPDPGERPRPVGPALEAGDCPSRPQSIRDRPPRPPAVAETKRVRLIGLAVFGDPPGGGDTSGESCLVFGE